jgi:hypothetical protein
VPNKLVLITISFLQRIQIMNHRNLKNQKILVDGKVHGRNMKHSNKKKSRKKTMKYLQKVID